MSHNVEPTTSISHIIESTTSMKHIVEPTTSMSHIIELTTSMTHIIETPLEKNPFLAKYFDSSAQNMPHNKDQNVIKYRRKCAPPLPLRPL